MIDNIERISRTIIQPTNTLYLRIHAKLITDKKDGRRENFHNVFTMNNKKSYLTLDLQSFLTLEIKDRNREWSPDLSVLLDQKNIYQVIRGFKKILNAIYNGNIFAQSKTGKIIIYKDEVEKHTERIYNIGTHQRLVVTPAIIHDEGVEYEGVVLFINKTENYAELTIDAFESLYYALKQTNLFVYSQVLVNYYMTLIQNNKIEIKQNVVENKPTTPSKPHPLLGPSVEKTTSTIKKKQSGEEFFGIPKSE